MTVNLVGQSLGRYHIIEQLGQGGMAVVYRGYDTRLEREVAVKVLRTDQFAPAVLERVLKRFEREAKALAKLSHPNIVKVYDYGEHQGAPYLVLEYLPGGTLKQRLKKPMAWREAVRLLLPIARALQFAHEQGILHRDVKPSNVLVTLSGEPMLADFGIAKILDIEEGQTLTATGVGVGTPEYMAPEQALESKRVDGRADVYSLGVVLYELVTGHKPYTADTPMAVVLKHLNDPLPRPRGYVADLPEAVEKVLYKALAKRAEDRYANMGEFAAGLEKLLVSAGEAAEAKPEAAAVEAKLGEPGMVAGVGEEETRDEWRTGEKPAEAKLGGRGRLWAVLAGAGAVLLLAVWQVMAGIQAGRGAAAETGTAEVKWVQVQGTATGHALALAQTGTAEVHLAQTATERVRPTPRAGEVRVREADGMEMVYVPAGVFWMGSEEGEGDGDEHPRHEVYLEGYWIDRYEVTNGQYERCVAAGKCSPPSQNGSYTRGSYYGDEQYADYPVIYVNWEQARRYCEWAGGRLPSEAEWEKAARGTDERRYPWGDEFDCRKGNFDDEQQDDSYVVPGGPNCDGYIDTAPVGSYPAGASPYGVLDMVGNVWEWVADWYGGNYYDNSPREDPRGPESGVYRVARGGSWSYDDNVRAALRLWNEPSNSNRVFGFLCALSP